jgi:hypothetical protein
MAEPLRKSRRIASKRTAPSNVSKNPAHISMPAVVEDPGVQFNNQITYFSIEGSRSNYHANIGNIH